MNKDEADMSDTYEGVSPARIRATYVIGPDGSALTPANLPTGDERWTPFRKAAVVAAVNGGLLSIDVACVRYGLTFEELVAWQRAYMRHGIQGLRATRARDHDDNRPALSV